MCGICGFVQFDNKLSQTDLYKMMQEINHRGPDSEGVYVDINQNIYFGHKRLSILDLSDKGSQPMISSNGTMVIIYNGEIYNHLELRRKYFNESKNWRGASDTETLIECFQELGIEKTLVNLTGMFVFALYDIKYKIFYLGRDRFGEKPCYYSHINSSLYFSSEIKSLKKIKDIDKSLDINSIYHQLNFSYIKSDRSVYSKIKNIQPGTCLKFDISNNKVELSETIKYWNTYDQIINCLNSKYNSNNIAEEEITEQLNKTVKKQLVADVEVGTFFSGGIDSTIVNLFASRYKKSKLRSFTISFENNQFDESYYAYEIAKEINLNLHIFKIKNSDIKQIVPKINDIYDEPYSDSSQIPTLFLSNLTREKGLKVVLTGDGGDEIFGGYNRYFFIKKFRILSFIPYKLRVIFSDILSKLPMNFWDYMFKILENTILINKKVPNFSLKVLKFLNLIKFRSLEEVFEISLRTLNLTHVLREGLLNLSIKDETIQKFEKIEDYMMYFDSVNYLPGDILVKVDRSTMQNSLESRAPFLDHNLFNIAWKMPHDLKFNKNSGKIVLKKILQKNLSNHLFQRPKMGFAVPLDFILKNELKDWCYEQLDPNFLKNYEFFDLKKIQILKDRFFNNNTISYVSIWNILILSDWLRKNA